MGVTDTNRQNCAIKCSEICSEIEVHAVVVTRARSQLLRRCLESLAREFSAQDFFKSFSIHLLENDADQATRDEVQQFQLRYPNLIVRRRACSSVLPPGEARNQLLRHISEGWIFFIDDDAYVPDGYAARWIEAMWKNPWAGIIGGANLNPDGSNVVACATSDVLAHAFGGGPFRARYARRPDREVMGTRELILCNLWVRVVPGLGFRQGIVAGEENLLLMRLKQEGVRALYREDLYVFHERRSTLGAFARQAFKYGTGRAQILLANSAWRLLAFAFVMCIGVALMFSSDVRPLLVLGAVFISVYATLLFAIALLNRRPLPYRLVLLAGFITLHVSYVLGIFAGLLGWGAVLRRDFKRHHDIRAAMAEFTQDGRTSDSF